MPESPDCPFCSFNLSSSSDPHDLVLAAGPRVKLLPALGMLVPGHLLVVTDEHFLSMADLDENTLARVSTWLSEIENILSQVFGSYMRFEHAGSANGCSSACVDHAHIHLLPVGDIFAEKVKVALDWQSLSTYKALYEHAQHGYAYLGIAEEHFVYSGYLESQWIRRRVGDYLGRDDWDWCLTRDKGELQKTLNVLHGSLQFD
jgi:diadenosine tetraphosphate (Ap4A) HIT family hydrolase